MDFEAKKITFISYFIMELLIIIAQLWCSYLLIHWSDKQLISFRRISLMSMTGCFVVTSFRAYTLVSSLTGFVRYLLFRTKHTISFFLFWLFSFYFTYSEYAEELLRFLCFKIVKRGSGIILVYYFCFLDTTT